MQGLFKGYWKYFALISAGAVLALVGGILGRQVVGGLLFGLGLAVVITFFILGVLKKQLFESKGKIILLFAVMVVLVGAGCVLMFAGNVSSGGSSGPNGNGMPPQMQQGSNPVAQSTQATDAATAAATIEPATATPTAMAATATATEEVVSSMNVCLNENTAVGYNLRIAPRDDAAFGGKIDAASCFVVDGKTSQYPGWYKMAAGQNGSTGISIAVDDSKYQLWIKGYYLETFGNDLEALPEVSVQDN